ncbi:MAG TPA: hypothetical protein PKY87_03070 [Terricaulis sp.]|nr:hypothetical protein [Terricaulis sp.]
MAQLMETTRHQRRNGAMRNAVRARANDVMDDFSELKKDVSRLADAAGKAARAEANHAGQKVRLFGGDIRQRASDTVERVTTEVRAHPGAALGATLGAGVILGLLLSRR